MKTTLTSGQLMAFLTLLNQHGMTPENFQELLEDGSLARFIKGRSWKDREREFGLERGEFWLPDHPEKLTFDEALALAEEKGWKVPHYSDLIRVEKNARENPENRKVFPELQKGSYWSGCPTLCSDTCGCTLMPDHKHYSSQNLRTEKHWVRFIGKVA